jgi:hypothetical protein
MRLIKKVAHSVNFTRLLGKLVNCIRLESARAGHV